MFQWQEEAMFMFVDTGDELEPVSIHHLSLKFLREKNFVFRFNRFRYNIWTLKYLCWDVVHFVWHWKVCRFYTYVSVYIRINCSLSVLLKSWVIIIIVVIVMQKLIVARYSNSFNGITWIYLCWFYLSDPF
jgi:hypothetical protein